MSTLWKPLEDELAIWRSETRRLPLWWRDDDAIAPTPALSRLTQLSGTLGLPVHLAVIPKPAHPDLVAYVLETPHIVPLVHGWAHENHAPEGDKKAEFGHPRADALAQVAAGLDRLRHLFGARLAPVFVPPWNRIDPGLVPGLADLGYEAVSTFTPRSTRRVAGLVQINTHVDPIHWRAGGGLVTPEVLVRGLVTLLQDRRHGLTDAAEPLGFLTHHLVHDAAIWDFTAQCLTVLLQGGAEPCTLLDTKDIP